MQHRKKKFDQHFDLPSTFQEFSSFEPAGNPAPSVIQGRNTIQQNQINYAKLNEKSNRDRK